MIFKSIFYLDIEHYLKISERKFTRRSSEYEVINATPFYTSTTSVEVVSTKTFDYRIWHEVYFVRTEFTYSKECSSNDEITSNFKSQFKR